MSSHFTAVTITAVAYPGTMDLLVTQHNVILVCIMHYQFKMDRTEIWSSDDSTCTVLNCKIDAEPVRLLT